LYRSPPAGAFDFAFGLDARKPKKIQKRRPEASGTRDNGNVEHHGRRENLFSRGE
jgi:ribosome assembly protein YihI (activator of Der GTPase)